MGKYRFSKVSIVIKAVKLMLNVIILACFQDGMDGPHPEKSTCVSEETHYSIACRQRKACLQVNKLQKKCIAFDLINHKVTLRRVDSLQGQTSAFPLPKYPQVGVHFPFG